MENGKTYQEEMEELKTEVDNSIKALKKAAKESMITLAMRAMAAGCTSYLIDKALAAFLPKELKGIVKAGAAIGAFFIPELVGNIAATHVEDILNEEEE